MRKTIIASALALASLLAVGTAAAAGNKLYAGVNLGHSEVNTNLADTDGMSAGLYVGHNFDKRFAVEAGYTRFATADVSPGKVYLDAVTVQGVARTPVPHFKHASVYAKAGLGYTHATGALKGHRFSPVAAVGIDYKLTPKVSLRAEHQYLHDFADSGAAVRNTVMGVNYRF